MRFSAFSASQLRSLAVAVIIAKLAVHFFVILLHGDEVGIGGIFILDGPSYVEGATRIASTGDFLNLPDIYHSPGFQLYLGALFLPFGASVLFAKVINLVLLGFTIWLVYQVGRTLFDPTVGLLAAFLVAFSPYLTLFTFLIQYEVLAATLILGLYFWIIRDVANRLGPRSMFLAGVMVSVLGLIQVRFLALAPILAALLTFQKAEAGRRFVPKGAIGLVLGVLVLVGPWSAYQSARHDTRLLVGEGSSFRFEVGNNPNATGASFPYPEIREPKGVDFIVEQPVRWLWLVKERFLYFWGFREGLDEVLLAQGKLVALQTSFLRPLLSWLERGFRVAYLALFAGGVTVAVRRACRGSLSGDRVWLLCGLIIAVMAPPLLTIASTRFTIPILPLILLLQAYAAVEIVRLCRRRGDRSRSASR